MRYTFSVSVDMVNVNVKLKWSSRRWRGPLICCKIKVNSTTLNNSMDIEMLYFSHPLLDYWPLPSATKQKTFTFSKNKLLCVCGIQKRRRKASWDLVKSMDPKIYLQFKFQFECGSGATEQLSVGGVKCE